MVVEEVVGVECLWGLHIDGLYNDGRVVRTKNTKSNHIPAQRSNVERRNHVNHVPPHACLDSLFPSLLVCVCVFMFVFVGACV
jgi:hypothetical protein